MLWPAFDTALCNLIRAELEPFMRECAPAMVQGLYFERLSFGLARPSILGVRSVPSWNAEHLAIGALAPPLSPAPAAAVGGTLPGFVGGSAISRSHPLLQLMWRDACRAGRGPALGRGA